ncbi:hypothetical protein BJV77DRAFT_1025985 [Russula vinacea]|nr:hypothetical protein BJV77DRAFT_1025985 [Russula vinacea]
MSTLRILPLLSVGVWSLSAFLAQMVRLLSADGWCDSILTHTLVGTRFLSMVTRPLLEDK